jgi:hypothetical protein
MRGLKKQKKMHAESGNHLYSIDILTEESNANQKITRKKRIFSAVECEVSTNPTESRNPRNGWKLSADLHLQRFFPAKKICKWISRRWGFYSVLESSGERVYCARTLPTKEGSSKGYVA